MLFQCLLSASLALAQAGQSTAAREITPLSGMAVLVLEHTEQARKAIVTGDATTARKQVELALAQAAEIQARSSPQTRPLLAPLVSEVERTSVTGPFKRKGWRFDKQTSVEVTEETRNVSLNVTMAADKLAAARRLLNRNDLAGADSELAAVENAVVAQSAGMAAPLVKARENLILARTRLMEDKPRSAEASLRAAAQALREQEARLSGRSPEGIAGLRREVEALAGKVEDNPPDALDKVNLWIERIGRLPSAR
ncbi:MAG: hypothetical protein IT158_22855 [Bryobacterales bacterium]|nr:hypothetical protein [Bryobacterales bacterium]